MRKRALLTFSLAANLVLAFGWFWSARQAAIRTEKLALAIEDPLIQVKTNVVIRRQFFTWQQVESDDYRVYVANLREIGCPEQTIRDIIIADVNTLYARKRAMEVTSPAQQWWKSEPDPEVVQAAALKIRALEEERRALLSGLLGVAWESGDLISLPRPRRQGATLDGPVLGILPDEVKRSVEQVVANFQDEVDAWRAQGRGSMADMARLNQQLRTSLAGILSPQQLEEFLLRYSATASALRTELAQLKYFETSPEEFRALFRATDRIEEEMQLLMGKTDQKSIDRIATLEQQRDNAIRRTLGNQRFAQYKLLQDESYREAAGAAREAGSPVMAGTLYEINQALGDELARIHSNTNLTDRQRAIQTKRAELEQLQVTSTVLGEALPSETALPMMPPRTSPDMQHMTLSGDTASSISRLYGISVRELLEANPNLRNNRLKVGEYVTIPSKVPAQTQ